MGSVIKQFNKLNMKQHKKFSAEIRDFFSKIVYVIYGAYLLSMMMSFETLREKRIPM